MTIGMRDELKSPTPKLPANKLKAVWHLAKFTFVASAFRAAGSLVVLLFWVYHSSLIVFLGAEFTQVYARRYASRILPETHAVRVGRKRDSI
jgi:uncharacterized BrkB/YihY/UPF0761 family membrane protein